MQDITDNILELVRLTSTDLPPDVEAAIRRAVEAGRTWLSCRGALETILKNVELIAPELDPHLPGYRHTHFLRLLPGRLEHACLAHADRSGCGAGH